MEKTEIQANLENLSLSEEEKKGTQKKHKLEDFELLTTLGTSRLANLAYTTLLLNQAQEASGGSGSLNSKKERARTSWR